MAMASERTAWAEGLGLTEEQVEELTLVCEEATQRRNNRERIDSNEHWDNLYLPPNDVGAWPAELESHGADDLAERVRAVMV